MQLIGHKAAEDRERECLNDSNSTILSDRRLAAALLWHDRTTNTSKLRRWQMNNPILNYEEKMWQLLDVTKREMPDLADAYYGSVKDAVYREGVINLKTKRLMSLAVAIQAGCKDCMISQTRLSPIGATNL